MSVHIPESKKWPEFTFAYQPIVDVNRGAITSFEALVRGVNNESADKVLQAVGQSARYMFDELLRCRAIELAQQLGINCRLNLNLMPRALSMLDSTIDAALQASDDVGFPRDLITLEVKENDIIDNVDWFSQYVRRYRSEGVKFAIDDFGKVYSGLNLLAVFKPDSVKVDHNLVRNIHQRPEHQWVLEATVDLCRKLAIDLVAEGVEIEREFETCAALGVSLFQGYLFCRPGFQHLPSLDDSKIRVCA